MNENQQEAELPTEEPESLTQLGDCLRTSFTAENHDSLGDDSTRSLLHLSHEPKVAAMRVTATFPPGERRSDLER